MAFYSAPRVLKYDVFLGFRGEDTRKTFVSHLYAALDRKRIVTFKDDQRLEIGDHISDKLRKAIEVSRFAVVVLSENYATSRWCLMELQLIMERMSHGKIDVFPVFYRVDPSAVRHQRGNFALDSHRSRETADTILRWGEALNLIASLTGVDSETCIDEATMVEGVARNIARRVTSMHKIDSKNIFGMKAQLEGLCPLLDLEFDEVRVIGIWGMGGIGKTSIAKCLYDHLSPKFTARCFIENIKSIRQDHDQDLMHLQKLVLCSILRDDIGVRSVEAGYRQIKATLGHRTVLLVLDGVDKVEQVHALAKETNWFGPGSRIIITTRDMGLLNTCGVKTVYKAMCLDAKDSLQMFNHIAFGEGLPPPDGFEQLSVRASRLAHGLPSALQTYALFLRGRNATPEQWEKALSALESSLNENIMEILKISYEGLPKPHQNVLLHVACLFNGDSLQRVTSLLDGSRPERSLGIRVLAEKSLIDISTTWYVTMPKLVEQMGRKIMRDFQKYLGDPEEICYALALGNGTEQTECMSLHTCEMTCALSMKTTALDRMRNLKFLKVYKHVDCRESALLLIQDSHDLPRTLRLFHWDSFPLRTLPFRLDPYFLVELNLRHSNLETLSSGTLVFRNLKRLDVTGSKNLTQLPDLPNIEDVILERCMRLKGIPHSIGKSSTLKRLKLSYYHERNKPLEIFIYTCGGKQLIVLEFPNATMKMVEVLSISVDGNIKLSSGFQGYVEYFSFTSQKQIPVTTTMCVQQAPQSISEFNKFSSLNIMRFSYKENGQPVTLHSFPDIPSLKELILVNLNIQKISDGIGQLKFLKKLDFSGNDFENLPEAMNSLSWLKTLWLRNCRRLKKLPELTQVQSLTLSNCGNLRSLVKLSDASQDRRIFCLIELCLDNCKNVKLLSDQLGYFTKLTYLDLSGHDFERLPSSIRDLTSLVTLCLNNCKKLNSVEELPPSLKFLDTDGCDFLVADSVQRFRDRQKKEPRNDCFQETDIHSFELKHQTTVKGCDLYEAGVLDYYKDRQSEEVPQRNDHFQETDMLSCELNHQITVPNHQPTVTGRDSLEVDSQNEELHPRNYHSRVAEIVRYVRSRQITRQSHQTTVTCNDFFEGESQNEEVNILLLICFYYVTTYLL